MAGWDIVVFTKDNSVEAVPKIWMLKDLCAWPNNSKHTKKFIERQMKPNSEDFSFHPARKLGNKTYSSLTEAKLKLKKATHKSDLSSTDDEIISMRTNRIPKLNSLSPEHSKNINFLQNERPFQISDSPPRYTQEITPEQSTSAYVLKSPIGNFIVQDISESLNNTPENKTKRVLFNTEPNQTIIYDTLPSASVSKTSVLKKEENYLMPPADFQNFVVNTLTKLKYDINQLISTTTATNLIMEKQTANIEPAFFDSQIDEKINIHEIFPIQSDNELNQFETKLEADKNFRSHLVSRLSLLVGTKSVGDSTRRLISKMFKDEVLVAYSLQGFKQKKSFQKLGAYQLLIDALRVHQKYKFVITKEFDIPLATWLSHAKFRIHEKKIKTINKSSNTYIEASDI